MKAGKKDQDEAAQLEKLAQGDDEHSRELDKQGHDGSAAYYQRRAAWRRNLAREARSMGELDQVKAVELPKVAELPKATKVMEVKTVDRK